MRLRMNRRVPLRVLASSAMALGLCVGVASAQSADPSQWSIHGNAERIAAATQFDGTGVTHFPWNLKLAQSTEMSTEYYVIHGREMLQHPGQYEYPFIVLTAKTLSSPVEAREIAINTDKHDALFAIGVASVSAAISPSVTCNAGDTTHNGGTAASWGDGTLTVVADQAGVNYCAHGNYLYSVGPSSWYGWGPDCAWRVTQNTGNYLGVANNRTSYAYAYNLNDYSCSGGPYNCEIDYQPVETDGYVTYYGHNDNTHIVNLGSTNCSAIYAPTYFATP